MTVFDKMLSGLREIKANGEKGCTSDDKVVTLLEHSGSCCYPGEKRLIHVSRTRTADSTHSVLRTSEQYLNQVIVSR